MGNLLHRRSPRFFRAELVNVISVAFVATMESRRGEPHDDRFAVDARRPRGIGSPPCRGGSRHPPGHRRAHRRHHRAVLPEAVHRAPRAARESVQPWQPGAGRTAAGAGRLDRHLRRPPGGPGAAASGRPARPDRPQARLPRRRRRAVPDRARAPVRRHRGGARRRHGDTRGRRRLGSGLLADGRRADRFRGRALPGRGRGTRRRVPRDRRGRPCRGSLGRRHLRRRVRRPGRPAAGFPSRSVCLGRRAATRRCPPAAPVQPGHRTRRRPPRLRRPPCRADPGTARRRGLHLAAHPGPSRRHPRDHPPVRRPGRRHRRRHPAGADLGGHRHHPHDRHPRTPRRRDPEPPRPRGPRRPHPRHPPAARRPGRADRRPPRGHPRTLVRTPDPGRARGHADPRRPHSAPRRRHLPLRRTRLPPVRPGPTRRHRNPHRPYPFRAVHPERLAPGLIPESAARPAAAARAVGAGDVRAGHAVMVAAGAVMRRR